MLCLRPMNEKYTPKEAEGENAYFALREKTPKDILEALRMDSELSEFEAGILAEELANEMWIGRTIDLTRFSPDAQTALAEINANIIRQLPERNRVRANIAELRQQEEAERAAGLKGLGKGS